MGFFGGFRRGARVYYFNEINWKRLASVFVPGVLIAAISIYKAGVSRPPSPGSSVLGKALAAYDDFTRSAPMMPGAVPDRERS